MCKHDKIDKNVQLIVNSYRRRNPLSMHAWKDNYTDAPLGDDSIERKDLLLVDPYGNNMLRVRIQFFPLYRLLCPKKLRNNRNIPTHV